MYIWKREYAPFRVGGHLRRVIKTKVEGYPINEELETEAPGMEINEL